MATPPNALLARRRHGAHADAWVAALDRGDPVADAALDELLAAGGRAGATRAVSRALRHGIGGVADAPPALQRLFAELDVEPDWVDHAALDRAAGHLARQTAELGLVLAAASLTAGARDAVASRPLAMTGRYAEQAAVRSIEVGSWLVAVTTPGGMRRHGQGFARTVRVRMIHAAVRRHLLAHPDWDRATLGVPIAQPHMAFTLVEFGWIALEAMRRLGVAYSPAELDDVYLLWRYVGHVIGVEPRLLPVDEADHRRVFDLYTLTASGPDDEDQRFVRALLADHLAPELARLLPPGARRLAPALAAGFSRAFLGDAAADELRLPDTPLKHVPHLLGPAARTAYGLHDLLPGGRARRTRRGFAVRRAELARMRAEHGIEHDLVDAAPDRDGHPVAA